VVFDALRAEGGRNVKQTFKKLDTNGDGECEWFL
jgi:hypothetical protein